MDELDQPEKSFIKRFWPYFAGVAIVIILILIIPPFLKDRRQSDSSIQTDTPDSSAQEIQSDAGTKHKTEQDRIIISLPFVDADEPYSIMPYGETVNHPGKIGHPGMDFYWRDKTRLIAVVDGEIESITQSSNRVSSSKVPYWEVNLKAGDYRIIYAELDDYNRDLTVGSQVKAGDFLGYPNFNDEGDDHYMTHWSFGFATRDDVTDYLCPVSYFDSSSLLRLNKIWTNDDQYV